MYESPITQIIEILRENLFRYNREGMNRLQRTLVRVKI